MDCEGLDIWRRAPRSAVAQVQPSWRRNVAMLSTCSRDAFRSPCRKRSLVMNFFMAAGRRNTACACGCETTHDDGAHPAVHELQGEQLAC